MIFIFWRRHQPTLGDIEPFAFYRSPFSIIPLQIFKEQAHERNTIFTTHISGNASGKIFFWFNAVFGGIKMSFASMPKRPLRQSRWDW
jgi:hypothetical protein